MDIKDFAKMVSEGNVEGFAVPVTVIEVGGQRSDNNYKFDFDSLTEEQKAMLTVFWTNFDTITKIVGHAEGPGINELRNSVVMAGSAMELLLCEHKVIDWTHEVFEAAEEDEDGKKLPKVISDAADFASEEAQGKAAKALFSIIAQAAHRNAEKEDKQDDSAENTEGQEETDA